MHTILLLINCTSYQPCTFLLPVPVTQPVFNFCLKVTAKTLTQHDELMKKTETMNVLMETNKLLREEKKKLDQELLDTQAKASHQKNSQLYLLVEILL